MDQWKLNFKQRLHYSTISPLVLYDLVTVCRRSILVTIRTQVYWCSYTGKADWLQYKSYNCNQYQYQWRHRNSITEKHWQYRRLTAYCNTCTLTGLRCEWTCKNLKEDFPDSRNLAPSNLYEGIYPKINDDPRPTAKIVMKKNKYASQNLHRNMYPDVQYTWYVDLFGKGFNSHKLIEACTIRQKW